MEHECWDACRTLSLCIGAQNLCSRCVYWLVWVCCICCCFSQSVWLADFAYVAAPWLMWFPWKKPAGMHAKHSPYACDWRSCAMIVRIVLCGRLLSHTVNQKVTDCLCPHPYIMAHVIAMEETCWAEYGWRLCVLITSTRKLVYCCTKHFGFLRQLSNTMCNEAFYLWCFVLLPLLLYH